MLEKCRVEAKTKGGAWRFCDAPHADPDVHEDASLGIRFRIEQGKAVDLL